MTQTDDTCKKEDKKKQPFKIELLRKPNTEETPKLPEIDKCKERRGGINLFSERPSPLSRAPINMMQVSGYDDDKSKNRVPWEYTIDVDTILKNSREADRFSIATFSAEREKKLPFGITHIGFSIDGVLDSPTETYLNGRVQVANKKERSFGTTEFTVGLGLYQDRVNDILSPRIYGAAGFDTKEFSSGKTMSFFGSYDRNLKNSPLAYYSMEGMLNVPISQTMTFSAGAFRDYYRPIAASIALERVVGSKSFQVNFKFGKESASVGMSITLTK